MRYNFFFALKIVFYKHYCTNHHPVLLFIGFHQIGSYPLNDRVWWFSIITPHII